MHQDFFDRSGLAFAIQDGKTISLQSERGANFPDAFQTDVPVTSMAFANKLYFMSPGFPMIKTDGLTFQKAQQVSDRASQSASKAAFMRLVVQTGQKKLASVVYSRTFQTMRFSLVKKQKLYLK